MTIIEAMEDPRIFRPLFKDLTTWNGWTVYLRALFGLPIEDRKDLELFALSTGLRKPGAERVGESFVICGRRSGKSYISALIAVYLACFKNWAPFLSPGERGWIFIIAVDKMQAGIIKQYVSGILQTIPVLRAKVERETAEAIDLKGNISIAVKTCSFRSVRGYTLLAAILEELAFYRSEESANPDKEVLAAVRPALATIPESLLLGISTPYSRIGVLFEQFRENFGKAGDTLIWQAKTETMNPTIDRRLIEKALAEDPEAARAEWLAEWRQDISSFIPSELIESLVVPGRRELPKVGAVSYHAFTDPSGGSEDSFALCVAHRDPEGRVMVDCLRERRPPFSAEGVVAEFSEVVRSYGLTRVRGDKYAGEWPREAFRRHGIDYQVAEKTASELFIEVLPVLTSGAVELLDHSRLKAQLANLERRVRSGGRDAVGHGPGGHDDIAVCVAGAILMAGRNGMSKGRVYIHGELVSGPASGRVAGPTRHRVFFCQPSSRTVDHDELIRKSLRRGRMPPPDDD